MDFSKIETFLRVHWPAAIIVLLISVPVIWTFATIHYTQQISDFRSSAKMLDKQIKTLQLQVDTLEEYKKRAEISERDRKKQRLSGGGVLVSFSSQSLADSLYSASDI